MDADRKNCPLCQKELSAKYLNTHIKKQHPDAVPPNKSSTVSSNKEKKGSVIKTKKGSKDITSNDINYTIPNNALSEIDIASFELMEVDEEDEELMAAMFSSMSVSSIPAVAPATTSNNNKEKKRNQPELAIQKRLEKQMKGGHKSTPVGIIDILGVDSIVEIKHWDNWKGALGQLIAYQYYYPNHMLHMHLFGPIPIDDKKIPIMTVCAHNRIKLTYEKG
jgi:hypothetical protein